MKSRSLRDATTSKKALDQLAQRCREQGIEMPEMESSEEAELLCKAQEVFEALQAETSSPKLAPK
jgi:hypothetical protein